MRWAAFLVRRRCALRGHPMGLSVTMADGTHEEWCSCGRPHVPDFYRTEDGKTWLRGRGPEPWR